MRPIVRVRDLSKRYFVGRRRNINPTLREALAGAVRSPLGRLYNNHRRSATQELWALKDVTFDVAPGEVVGVIGRNGAGKSTLLKILSRITKPSVGEVDIYGRVGSLLEVGTGFHPDLTGRENVYLNGTILGMKRQETRRKFDEIVAFAGVERFLDTPVKHYSTGMYLRLAFAIAAHLEPEILILDEVIAVGDVSFQTKCYEKMREVSTQGRTVFFVSHNMATVESLCKRALYIRAGRLADDGETAGVTAKYVSEAAAEELCLPFESALNS